MSLSFPANPVPGQIYQQWIFNSNGAWQSLIGGGAPINVQVFTASGTYTPSPGMTTAIVECVGGGGGTGSVAGAASIVIAYGGGGAGGYSRSLLTAAQIGASQPVAIGAGGAGGAGGAAAGSAGAATSFGSLVIANGGASGSGATGGVGATAGTGQIAAPGAPGVGGGQVATGNAIVSGAGGSTQYGGGGRSVYGPTGAVTAGQPGQGYGSGAGGSFVNNAAGSNPAGGAGAPGVCIVTEYTNVTPVEVFPVLGIGAPIGMQVFTASGTYTPTSGTTTAIVECVGGGGGGAGVTGAASVNTAGGGGGAGGYSRSVISAAQIGASQPVTIGARGVGGTNGPTAGTAGGTTSFGSLVIANGGGGALNFNNPAAGGAAGTGQIAVPGAPGGQGNYLPTGSGVPSGPGGSTVFGGGGAPAYAASGSFVAGNPGGGYGSGGSGGSAYNTGGSATGAAGAPGICVVTEYSSEATAIKGVTDGSNAQPGMVGEFLTASPASNVSIPTSSSIAMLTMFSLTLPPGDWDVWGQLYIGLTVAGNTGACISSSTATNNRQETVQTGIPTGGGTLMAAIAQDRWSITVPTTLNMLAYASAGGGTMYSVGSLISARRVR